MPPQCGAFSRDLQDKSQSPRYPGGGGGPWLQMTSALVSNVKQQSQVMLLIKSWCLRYCHIALAVNYSDSECGVSDGISLNIRSQIFYILQSDIALYSQVH